MPQRGVADVLVGRLEKQTEQAGAISAIPHEASAAGLGISRDPVSDTESDPLSRNWA